jgi:hypothetical protein
MKTEDRERIQREITTARIGREVCAERRVIRFFEACGPTVLAPTAFVAPQNLLLSTVYMHAKAPFGRFGADFPDCDTSTSGGWENKKTLVAWPDCASILSRRRDKNIRAGARRFRGRRS